MMGRTHMATAAASWLPASLIITGHPHPEALPLVVFASILPDVDHPGSKAGRRLVHMLWPTLAIAAGVWYLRPGFFHQYAIYFVIPAIFFALPFILYYTVGHRTLTHSIFTIAAMIALSAIAYVYASSFAFLAYGITFGYAMHILCDWITDEGIVFLWPMNNRRYHAPLHFKTNGIIEYIVLIVSMVGFGYTLWNYRGVIFHI